MKEIKKERKKKNERIYKKREKKIQERKED